MQGASGLDCWNECNQVNGGIHAMLACECNKYCRMTIDQNEPGMALIGDINKYEPEEILKLAGIPEGRKVDVIFGGPPCQAYRLYFCVEKNQIVGSVALYFVYCLGNDFYSVFIYNNSCKEE